MKNDYTPALILLTLIVFFVIATALDHSKNTTSQDKIIKTTKKPNISFELTIKGQKVYTVYVYDFNR